MAVAYPDYQLLIESTDSAETGFEVERATNGALRMRSMYPSDKLTMTASHMVPKADGQALVAFYDANRTAEIQINWIDGITRYAHFSAKPKVTRYSKHWKVQMTLEEI